MLPTSPAGLVLTPGAGADRDHSTLVAIEEALELPVLRLTLATTSVPRAVERIVDATHDFASDLGVSTGELIIGGRSFGGRSCSVAVAEGLDVAGLLLLSYPLHPPGKREKLRVDHFPDIATPTLFISGEKDPFGTSDEFATHLPQIPAATKMLWVPGAHSPKGNQERAVVNLVKDALVP